jgi:GT2 family glycosyltransferase
MWGSKWARTKHDREKGANMVHVNEEINPENNKDPGFQPVRLLDIELSLPLQEISSFDPKTGRSYQRGLAFIFLHHFPLGSIDLEFDGYTLTPVEVSAQIWEALSAPINQHLMIDKVSSIARLDVGGIQVSGPPACWQKMSNALDDPPSFSVVVCTRDHPESLAVTLDSLQSLDYPHYEIILVDNAPATNATLELVQADFGSLKNLRYVREDRPGLSAARNRGLAESKGEFIAYTDDDVKVDARWLKRLVQGFSLGENVACVTGLVLPAEIETSAQAMMEQYGGMGKGFVPRIFDLDCYRSKQGLYPFTAGSFGVGANMAYKTSVLRSFGGFDLALGTGTLACGGEDLAMFFNIVTQGYQLVYQPCAFIRHYHRRTYAAFQKQAFSYGVGLTAYLTKIMLDRPSRLFELAMRIPAGVWYLLDQNSPKNQKKHSKFPSKINWLERKGMLYGPLAYWRSRRQVNMYERKHTLAQKRDVSLPARKKVSHQ